MVCVSLSLMVSSFACHKHGAPSLCASRVPMPWHDRYSRFDIGRSRCFSSSSSVASTPQIIPCRNREGIFTSSVELILQTSLGSWSRSTTNRFGSRKPDFCFLEFSYYYEHPGFKKLSIELHAIGYVSEPHYWMKLPQRGPSGKLEQVQTCSHFHSES